MAKRVYITGTGMITPAGADVSANWRALCEGQSGLRTLGDGLVFGAVHPDSDQQLTKLREDKFRSGADLSALAAIISTGEAVIQADSMNKLKNAGVILGSSRGPIKTMEASIIDFDRNARITDKWRVAHTLMSSPAASVCQEFGTTGTNLMVSTACTSGINAVSIAHMMIATGNLELAITGGTESPGKHWVEQFKALGIYTKELESNYPVRPGHPDSKGTAFGEGAASLVLESNPSTIPLAEIVGFGLANENVTPTGVSENGRGLQEAILKAVQQARLNFSEIDLIVGHGSGTQKGDSAEAAAYQELFADRLPAITYNKWLTGHMLGASGAISIVLACEHLRCGLIPRLPYFSDGEVAGRERRQNLNTVLICAMGFGGSSAAIIIKKVA